MKRLLNTLYVTNPDAMLRKKDDAIAIFVDDKQAMSVPFHLLEGVVLFGHVGCSTALLGACAARGVTVTILDERARFQARVEGPVSGNVLLRREQYRKAAADDVCLDVARRFVVAKLHNTRVVLQHYARDYPNLREVGIDETINVLRCARDEVARVSSIDELRGIEGNGAHAYFGILGKVLRPKDEEIRFSGRSRRPPRDEVNATLSFFYTLLAHDMTSACETVGLDPQLGFLHACRPGRNSLALDLMEELRAPMVDRFVMSLFNRGQLRASSFAREGQGVFFTDTAMKKALRLWQERKQEQVTHPYLEERVRMGLLPFLQAQLFARYVRGDLDGYPAMLWR